METRSEPQWHVSTCSHQKPAFVQPIASCTVRHGEVVRFHACVSGTPRPEVSWFHERQPMRPSGNVIFHFDEVYNTATLIIVDTFSEHAGCYTCRAVNAAGEATCTAMLAITTEEEEKEVEEEGEGNSWTIRPVPYFLLTSTSLSPPPSRDESTTKIHS